VLAKAKGVVEKPEPAVAPSTLTIIGRYIIQPEVFGHLGQLKPGSGNEIQLTDGLDQLIADGQPFHGLRVAAKRYDCGDKLGYLEANVALGLHHPTLGDRFQGVVSAQLEALAPKQDYRESQIAKLRASVQELEGANDNLRDLVAKMARAHPGWLTGSAGGR
jgi:dTDP-glucose pyrophosphorylase